MVFCIECKSENDDNAVFCAVCGHELNKDINNAIICPVCGSKNIEYADICSECGLPFSSFNIDDESHNESSGYLVCNSCFGVYELKEDESPEDFHLCQCGGELKFSTSKNDINNFFDKIEDEVIGHIKDGDSEFKVTSTNLVIYGKYANTSKSYSLDKIKNLTLKKSRFTADLKFEYLNEPISKPISLKAFDELKQIFKETSSPLIVEKPNKRSFDIYMCPNLDCIYKNKMQKENKCPVCLTPARKMSSLRAGNISRIKDKKLKELQKKEFKQEIS